MKLRETKNLVANKTPRGVRISTKEPGAYPRSRTVKPSTWAALAGMSDSEFDGSCTLELGIGAFQR